MVGSEDEMIVKAVRWATRACEAIQNAGGSARVLDDFTDKSLVTCVRNGIGLKHESGTIYRGVAQV